MCQYSCEDGFATDWHLVHLGSRAVGGAGLVMQEATAVTPDGRISYGDLGIWKNEHMDMLSRIVRFIHSQGSKAGIQLAHAGRKASAEVPWLGGRQIKEGDKSWQTIAPSAIPFYEEDKAPVAMSTDEIAGMIASFVAAAERAQQCGYDVVEIHGAHGYLIHQFLSPLSNQRTDAYGGSFENRVRFLLEITRGIRKIWPAENPLFVRLSVTEYAEGGWSADDSVALAKILQQEGVDLVDCSSGGNLPHVRIPLGPGYQVPLAEKIKRETGMATGAVGLITTAQQAEDILQEDKADLILIARESLRDPYFPLHAAHELNEDIKWPAQYERAKPKK